MESFFETLETFSPAVAVVLILILLFILNTWIFNRLKSSRDVNGFRRGSISFIIVLVGILAFILTLPIEKSLKGQMLSFLGIIISAAIALSSTTVLGNLIAGIMNNSMDRFRNGDLIQINDLLGRVTKKGIYHTEIQLEDSNFVTIPNLFIATHPVKLTRKTNSVIATTVSLGYDVSRIKIEEALKEAANEAGLSDPYVFITALGDFSVSYKIHGFLEDSNKFFSTSSLLNEMVMDALHEENIEIVSPTFMNQRRVDETQFRPQKVIQPKPLPDEKETPPEEMVFDKAIESEKIEQKREYIREIEQKSDALKDTLKELKEEPEITKTKAAIDRLQDQKERLEQSIKKQSKKEGQ